METTPKYEDAIIFAQLEEEAEGEKESYSWSECNISAKRANEAKAIFFRTLAIVISIFAAAIIAILLYLALNVIGPIEVTKVEIIHLARDIEAIEKNAEAIKGDIEKINRKIGSREKISQGQSP